MARQVTVQFGGAVRTLRYRMRDRLEIEQKSGGRLLANVIDDELIVPDEEGGIDVTKTRLETLVLTLFCGVRHQNAGIKEADHVKQEHVEAWLDEYMEAGESYLVLALACKDAIYLSGVLGASIDMRARAEAKKKAAAAAAQPEVDGSEGKGSSSSSSAESSPAA